MSIRFIHRGTRSASRLAWGLIPLAIIIGVLLLLRPPASDPGATATQLETRPGATLLAVNSAGNAAAVAPGFVPPAPARRDQVLQRLSQFRADYKQLAPAMTVDYPPDSPDSAKLADELTRALSQYGLDRGAATAGPTPDNGGGNWSAPMVVHTAKGNEETVRRLLEALAPYFSAQVLLVFDDTRINELTLSIRATPAFTEDGLAVFQ